MRQPAKKQNGFNKKMYENEKCREFYVVCIEDCQIPCSADYIVCILLKACCQMRKLTFFPSPLL